MVTLGFCGAGVNKCADCHDGACSRHPWLLLHCWWLMERSRSGDRSAAIKRKASHSNLNKRPLSNLNKRQLRGARQRSQKKQGDVRKEQKSIVNLQHLTTSSRSIPSFSP